jgi:hypothetical protein
VLGRVLLKLLLLKSLGIAKSNQWNMKGRSKDKNDERGGWREGGGRGERERERERER